MSSLWGRRCAWALERFLASAVEAFTPRGCAVCGRGAFTRAEVDRAGVVLRNRRSGFLSPRGLRFSPQSPLRRFQRPAAGGGGLGPDLHEHSSAVWPHFLRPQRSRRIVQEVLSISTRRAERLRRRAAASAIAGPLHWQPQGGLPTRARRRRARRSHTGRARDHTRLNDGPPRVHLRLRRRADGRRPHREGDADL